MARISVCMATYNGERYLAKQLSSILSQLGEGDEVVISDDSSTDKTLSIIESFQDSRIRILANQTFGNPIFNFENALTHATGDLIFLSDQDDVWMPDKVQKVVTHLATHDLVLTNCEIIDSSDQVIVPSFFQLRFSGKGFWPNLIRNSYLGCCMALKKKVLDKALPFPRHIPMHDWWIGLVAAWYFKVAVVHEPLIKYRRHSDNASSTGGRSNYSIHAKLRFRASLLRGLLSLILRS